MTYLIIRKIIEAKLIHFALFYMVNSLQEIKPHIPHFVAYIAGGRKLGGVVMSESRQKGKFFINFLPSNYFSREELNK